MCILNKMTPQLQISQCLVDRLCNITNETYGLLYGLMYNNTLLVMGVETNDNVQTSEITLHFPTEIDFCGVVTFEEGDLKENVKNILLDVDVTDNPVLLNCKKGETNYINAFFYVHDRMEEIKYEIITDETLMKEFIYLRLQSKLQLTCDFHLDALHEAMNSLRKKLVSGQVAFNCLKTDAYILGNNSEVGLSGLTREPLVGELCDSIEQNEDNYNSRKKKIHMNILLVQMFWKPTYENSIDVITKHSPIVNHTKKNFKCINLNLSIDAMSMVHRSMKVVDLYVILVESLCRNLKLNEVTLTKQMNSTNRGENNSTSDISIPVPYHFFPNECGHFISVFYPKNSSDDDLFEERKLLHKQLLLPLKRPYFRHKNAYLFNGNMTFNGKLINPHEGLFNSVKGGEVSIVKGKYAYYHYMQDNMDDDGWGCAYRSLQTLCSWFSLQGYVNKPVPTHKEIQECLVRIGDKPYNFINSKQWIGSTEVSFCLESLLGITSKIISVSSGEDLITKGSELSMHFKYQGTPIMIGGGVLAHTILGVERNKDTGELRFLILDPHYKGTEDLSYIQSKGWCCWKKMDFWKKSAYYNLCLPQVPTCI